MTYQTIEELKGKTVLDLFQWMAEHPADYAGESDRPLFKEKSKTPLFLFPATIRKIENSDTHIWTEQGKMGIPSVMSFQDGSRDFMFEPLTKVFVVAPHVVIR